jgi:hypothetical protein
MTPGARACGPVDGLHEQTLAVANDDFTIETESGQALERVWSCHGDEQNGDVYGLPLRATPPNRSTINGRTKKSP